MYHQKPVPTFQPGPFSINFHYNLKYTITSPHEPIKSNTNQTGAILLKHFQYQPIFTIMGPNEPLQSITKSVMLI